MSEEETTQISFFLGGQRAGISHVYDRLMKNKRLLRKHKIHVVDADEARRAISGAVTAFNNHKPVETIRESFMAAIEADSGKYKSVIVISDGVSGQVQKPMAGDTFYALAKKRSEMLGKILFPLKPKYFLGIRNPATFIPSAYGATLQNGAVLSFEEFIEPASVRDLAWSNTVERIIPEIADKALYLWRVEDYEFVWRDVIVAMSGLSDPDALTQNPKPLNSGLSLAGADALYSFHTENPGIGAKELQKAIDKIRKDHPSGEAPPADHPIWTPELIDDLTYRYEDDWYYIERLEEVNAISRRPAPIA